MDSYFVYLEDGSGVVVDFVFNEVVAVFQKHHV